jgi:hypothetical protein
MNEEAEPTPVVDVPVQDAQSLQEEPIATPEPVEQAPPETEIDADPEPEQAATPTNTAASHPADSVLARIESEIDGLLHSPLAMANWVKDMVREARNLL